jgi:hypothetical protein
MHKKKSNQQVRIKIRKVSIAHSAFVVVWLITSLMLSLIWWDRVLATQWVTDLWDAFDAWALSHQTANKASYLVDAIKKWNLFTRALRASDAVVSTVALETLKTVHGVINNQCNGQLARQDVAVVLWETVQWRVYRNMIERRQITWPIRQKEFPQSCIRVMQCAQWWKVDVNPHRLLYTTALWQDCTDLVQGLWYRVGIRLEKIASIPLIHVGDEILVNGDTTDGPFDLLHDIQMINNVMFTKPRDPAIIHSYDLKKPYVYNWPSPKLKTQWPWWLYEKMLDEPQLPPVPSLGIDRSEINEVNDAKFKQSQREWDITLLPNNGNDIKGSPITTPIQQIPWQNDGDYLSNNLCFEPAPEIPDPEYREIAQTVQEAAITYNSELDFESRVMNSIAWAVPLEWDEQWWQSPWEPFPEEIAKAIATEIDPRAWPDVVKAFINHFKWCVAATTDIDPDTYQSTIRKNITQILALVECVNKTFCKEYEAPTGDIASLVIVVCKIPPRAYHWATHQQVSSIEDVITEQLNVCFDAKDSGQLMKTIKPKDAWTVMASTSVLKDMFSFRILMRNDLSRRNEDPLINQDYQLARYKTYQHLILNLYEDPRVLAERNKYIIVGQPPMKEFEPNPIANTTKIEELAKANERLNSSWLEKERQKTTMIRIIEEYKAYVEQQMEFWEVANSHIYATAKTVESAAQKWKK